MALPSTAAPIPPPGINQPPMFTGVLGKNVENTPAAKNLMNKGQRKGISGGTALNVVADVAMAGKGERAGAFVSSAVGSVGDMLANRAAKALGASESAAGGFGFGTYMAITDMFKKYIFGGNKPSSMKYPGF